jgi:hypothetical protein
VIFGRQWLIQDCRKYIFVGSKFGGVQRESTGVGENTFLEKKC